MIRIQLAEPDAQLLEDETMADLKQSLRASLCYYQTVRGRVQSLIAGCYTQPENQTDSSGA